MAAVLLSAASWSPPGLGSPRLGPGGAPRASAAEACQTGAPSPAPASAFHPRHEPEAPELRPPRGTWKKWFPTGISYTVGLRANLIYSFSMAETSLVLA